MTLLFKRGSVIAGLIISSFTGAYGQNLASAEAQDPKYVDVLKERAEKIVNTLGIHEPAEEEKVRDLIVMQYYNLSKIHDARDNQLEALNEQNEDEESLQNRARSITRKAEKDIKKLHKQYITRLSAVLDATQLDQVKDGMTYGVLPLTYKAYLNLLPNLTAEEKRTIKEYLVTARELAMDEGSSEKKHHCFGEYKGKINNFLSARGYDLKQAEKALKARNETK